MIHLTMTEKKSWVLIFAGEEGEGEGFLKRGFEGMGYMIMRRLRDRETETWKSWPC